MDRFPDDSWNPARADVLALLAEAPIVDAGMIPSASNYVFLLALEDTSAGRGYAIYKPGRGEVPLWDFPPELHRREYASYLLSEALGWHIVPPTVVREQGLEHGVGSLQLYIPHDQNRTFFDLRDDFPEEMHRFAVFDWLANNADRKGGHVIVDGDGHLWGIDQGLTFHVEEKLRTVIWDYASEAIAPALLADVEALGAQFPDGEIALQLRDCLAPAEIERLRECAGEIVRVGRLPEPPKDRRPYPWPLI
jgi:hypothetical protein